MDFVRARNARSFLLLSVVPRLGTPRITTGPARQELCEGIETSQEEECRKESLPPALYKVIKIKIDDFVECRKNIEIKNTRKDILTGVFCTYQKLMPRKSLKIKNKLNIKISVPGLKRIKIALEKGFTAMVNPLILLSVARTATKM
jgi:hypothetical protein